MAVEQRTKRLVGTRILVVEVEYYLAADLSRALEDAGADVVGPVGSLHEAEVTVAAGGFDCAVIDMNLRGSVAHCRRAAGTSRRAVLDRHGLRPGLSP